MAAVSLLAIHDAATVNRFTVGTGVCQLVSIAVDNCIDGGNMTFTVIDLCVRASLLF